MPLGAAGTGPKDRDVGPGSSLALAWSPDGRYLATGDQGATVHFRVVRDVTAWASVNDAPPRPSRRLRCWWAQRRAAA